LASLSMIEIAGCYVTAHVLVGIATVLLAGLRLWSARSQRPFRYRHLLLIGRLLALSALCLPLLALWHGNRSFSPLRVQVWAAPSMFASPSMLPPGGQIELGLSSARAFLTVEAAALAATAVFVGGLLLTLLRLIPEARATFRAVHESHSLRSLGSVRLRVSDSARVPFATWIPGRRYIVVPAALLLRPADLRLAVRHEAQHHRQHDAQFLYAALLARALFGLNPMIHWLMRQLVDLQELACDEALSGRPGHSPDGYCGCLLRIAAAAVPIRGIPLRSCMSSRSGNRLAFRIESLLRSPAASLRARSALGIGLLGVVLLAALCALLAVPIADHRISRGDAEQLSAHMSGFAGDALHVNEAVVHQLNLFLATPDGRAYVGSGLTRMRKYQPSITAALTARKLPLQLLAVPLVESAYRNLPAHPGAGAGLWMFIAPTARHYGLKITSGRDQRLDVPAETAAATQMLSDLWSEFRDWPLALMAYNSGASRVQAAIQAVHSRDAWALYRAGYGNDPNYLARITAMTMILGRPEWITLGSP